MKEPRQGAGAAVCNGKIIVCGGWNGEHLKSAEFFDLKTGVWSLLNQMPTPLSDHSLLSVANQLIMIGGKMDRDTVVCSIWRGSEDKWKELAPMKTACNWPASVIFGGEIYAIGGSDGRELRKVEIFNGKGWRDGPDLPYKCAGAASLIVPQDWRIRYRDNNE